MKDNKHRKLAAILFADIVGYTALMQKDEVAARQLLDKFYTTLNKTVEQHKGQVINNYGDGCLCTFDSAVAAVQCAKEVQLIFQSEPNVPVRVGLHSGDVFFEKDNVFGDSVNIASRIESLGVAGAVLFSKQIKRHIANQTDFKVQSLGEFDFKNVEKSMEVFGLANEGLIIPLRSEMKGKTIQAKKHKWFVPMVSLALLIAALGIWQFLPSNSLTLSEPEILTANTPLPPNVLNERVAIIPIQNNTNNKDLDILGKMAADWISRGLMNIENAEVVSPYTVNQHLDAIGILPKNAQGRPSFSELTGARNFIQGSFYKEKDELIFLMELVDAIDGKIKFGFPEIRGDANEKEALITQLQENIAGYWATKDLVDSKRIKAPNFKAYQNYLERLEKGMYDDNPLEAIQLDSTFYLARIHFLNANRIGDFGDNEVHFQFFKRHIDNLRSYERAWYIYIKSLYEGNPIKAFESLNEARKKHPYDSRLNHECATVAKEWLHNPELAIEIFEQLPLENISRKKTGELYNYRLINQTISYLYLNQLDKSKEFLKKFPPNKEAALTSYYSTRLMDASKRNDKIQIEKWKQAFLNTGAFLPVQMGLLTNTELLTDDLVAELSNGLILKYETLTKKGVKWPKLYYSNLYAWLTHQPNYINLENLDQLPKTAQIYELLNAGFTYLEASQPQKIPYILSELEKLTRTEYKVIAGWGSGLAYYSIGLLYTKMGETEQALEALRASKKHGGYSGFQYDKRLSPLFDNPEFKEIIKPIWPEMKD